MKNQLSGYDSNRGLAFVLLLLVIMAWPAMAAMTTVAGLFEAGDYSQAANDLANGAKSARRGEEVLWRSRLATDPAVAITILDANIDDKNLSSDIRLRMALELADIRAGLGQHGKVLAALMPVIDSETANLPGIIYLKAGLSMRATGRLQRAREMLASVRPDDPEFVLARYYLGDIGLEEKDPVLALRYFEAAAKATDQAGRGRLAAGMWRAYMANEQGGRAEEMAARLIQSDPGSLSLLEISRLRQMEADEQRARAAASPSDEQTVTPVQDLTGRYALQIGAFSDRGLALDFVKRYSSQLPNLRIDNVRDDRGQFLYKVRAGDYVNPALARSDAKQWARQLDIEIIVADLSAQGE